MEDVHDVGEAEEMMDYRDQERILSRFGKYEIHHQNGYFRAEMNIHYADEFHWFYTVSEDEHEAVNNLYYRVRTLVWELCIEHGP